MIGMEACCHVTPSTETHEAGGGQGQGGQDVASAVVDGSIATDAMWPFGGRTWFGRSGATHGEYPAVEEDEVVDSRSPVGSGHVAKG